jgi:predicted PurR-regulated permease PerM
MVNDLNKLSASFDPMVHLAQAFGVIVFIGGFAAMLWNLVVVWTGRRRWPARLWSVVLVLAAFVVLWIAFAFHLIGFGVNY